MVKTYDPDFNTWHNKINTYLAEHRNASLRSMLNREELIDAYDIMRSFASDEVMKFHKDSLEIAPN